MGSVLARRFVPDLSLFARGTVLAINAETGEFISAPSEAEALDAFGQRFGWGVPACVHTIG